MVLRWAPVLILKSAARAVRGINRQPLFVAPEGRAEKRPRLPASERTPDVRVKRAHEAAVKETPRRIAGEHGVAAEVIAKHTGERPGRATIAGVAIAGLPEIRANVVELSPADAHLVAVCWIHRNRWLVRRVLGDVLAVAVNVHLVTGKGAVLRDHC